VVNRRVWGVGGPLIHCLEVDRQNSVSGVPRGHFPKRSTSALVSPTSGAARLRTSYSSRRSEAHYERLRASPTSGEYMPERRETIGRFTACSS
jgi:hypothetical protein